MTFRFRGRPQYLISFILFIIFFFILYQVSNNFNIKTSKKNFMVSGSKNKDFFMGGQVKDNLKFNGEKLIHLDLKGAPPLLSYYYTFFPFIKKLGATGLLIEYEDMFPYENDLEEIRAQNSYTHSDIKTILSMAKANNLSVIPLIQTFGHLEFVLKLKNFKELREVDHYPQVLCPSHNKTEFFLHEMIKQILLAHPETKYIHIGCDEVYYLGHCDRCLTSMKENYWNKNYLFLNHVMNIITHINNTYSGVRPILWGDMFAKIEKETIKEFKINEMADVMVWKYTTDITEFITDDLLYFYAEYFKSIWIASAFKGATGVNQIVTNARHHLANHISWIDVVYKWKDQIHFKGIALTGWQRYDHFSVLCELLPVSIPSLTLSLYYLQETNKVTQENKILNILECNSSIPFSPEDIEVVSDAECNFPGFPIFQLINHFYSFTQHVDPPKHALNDGWFSMYNIVNKFSSPAHIEEYTKFWPVEVFLDRLNFLEENISKELKQVYDEHTVKEWILTYVAPLQMRLKAYFLARKSLMEQNEWPRRPLMNGTETFQKAMNKICDFNKNFGCGLLLP